MAAPRPGNDDRGWNDPPMFDYVAPIALSNASSPRRTQLNKRVAFPMSGSSPSGGGVLLNPEQGPPKLDVQILPPATNLDTPTPVPVLVPSLVPNPGTVEPSTAPPACPGAQTLKSLISKLEIELIDLQKYIYDNLLKMVEEFKDRLQGRASEDVKRRLDVMNSMWSEGKLSDLVQLKVGNLLQALKENDIKTANQLHISLMVDHTAEVNQWMVAIKRLIVEKQNSCEETNFTTDNNSEETTPSTVPFFTPSATAITQPGNLEPVETTQPSVKDEG
ncbi:steroid receptor RNA activator 1 [Patella vulgata]|uniref:steroid receptor RNA activator 1 n=1 Tax=Patella vulgata TaxID=6465 RepID=UPI00217FDA37|nr:steroid receptor RNA activator 1 [Patella vulgata]